ncbi:hypothetical protein [Coraliomargarita parva]|uniref:hypothetical protein n=1 Tax=Coraliomargarita parva TaxID=3014050 RepID=UPI0022B4298C|nr:hypothetical protein [Coraliomargarita parva]
MYFSICLVTASGVSGTLVQILRFENQDSTDLLSQSASSKADFLNQSNIDRSGPVLQDLTTPPEQDLQRVDHLLRRFVELNEQALPSSSNRQLTKTLTHPNGLGKAALPSNHPSINRNGELVDRWRTAYKFMGRTDGGMEIRSAGADRLYYTADDLVWPQPAAGSMTELAQTRRQSGH